MAGPPHPGRRPMMRYCAQPGCPTLVPRGYCGVHRPMHRNPWALRQAPRRLRGYDAAWVRLRTWFMRQPENVLCVYCLQNGRTVVATDCDHIQPFQGLQDPRRLDPNNLQALCAACHRKKTAAEADHVR